jgi:hypothetical protein
MGKGSKEGWEFVIPGQPAGLSPESITPVSEFIIQQSYRECGFRACAKRRIPE